MNSKIIVLETEGHFAQKLRAIFAHPDFALESVSSLSDLANRLEQIRFDIILLTSDAIKADPEPRIDILRRISEVHPKIQIILLVDPNSIELAHQTLKAGVFHYTKLPVSNHELRLLIETALAVKPRAVDELAEAEHKRDRLYDLVGTSGVMQRVFNQIQQAAETEIPVLILGDTGTGKDLVAQTIHRLSPRKAEPYLAVNLGALPTQLVASELFGHEKGAFTGAIQQHHGVFEQGNQGTVFLDEIDTTDEKTQVALLRLIEQKKFTRLGGRRSLISKARLIAASNENLEQLAQTGGFRLDLFYRLDVFRIHLPSLSERLSDIPLLVDEILLKYNKVYKRNITSIKQECLDAFLKYDWPGNIRELKNVVQRAVLICNSEKIELQHLPARFQGSSTDDFPTVSFKIGTSLNEIEREMILRALAVANNNRKRAAELLGISRRAIYNKLQKHNL